MTFGSLFAGIGGLDLGLERSGMVCKWQVENNKYAIRVLERHWPNVKRWKDVKAFPPNAQSKQGQDQSQNSTDGQRRTSGTQFGQDRSEWGVDLVCGGFPCQPVSQAGRRRGDADERWLWDEMRRVCEMVQPRWVLAENVPGLLSASSGRLFGTVVRDLADLGYCVEWDCIPAAAVGAPHIRYRVFIVGYAPSNKGRISDGNSQTDVANPSSPRRRGRDRSAQQGEETPYRSTEVADAESQGPSESGWTFRTEAAYARPTGSDWWATEPDVGRVAYGVPARVDRLRTLGNAVVPQVAEYIGRRILASVNLTPAPQRVT